MMDESRYRVLLVEDETLIREGMRDVIDWESLGCNLAAEARNGQDGLALFEELAPDIVITDIRMPKMDGLSLASTIRSRSKETKIIILTGFDEFEYARTALKLNVTDYLLKPVSPRELSDILSRVKKDLDIRKNGKGVHRKTNETLRFHNLTLRMALLKLISGITDGWLIESINKSDTSIRKAQWFCSIVYDFDGIHRVINPDDYRAKMQVINSEGMQSELIPEKSGSLIEVAFSMRKQPRGGVFADIVNRKRMLISTDTGLSVSAGIGNAVSGITAICSSYESALANLSKRYVRGGDSIFHAVQTNNTGARNGPEPILYFLKSVESTPFLEWKESLSELVQRIKQTDAPRERSLETMTLAVSAMVNALKRDISIKNPSEAQGFTIIQKARSYKTISGLHRWLDGLIDDLTLKEEFQNPDTSFTMARNAKKYIDENYMYSSLALDNLCRRFGVSLSTFSRLFRTCFDTNFSSYLGEVRIRAAKRLICQTDLRNKEIAFRVGFNSPHYFSRVFTQRVGCSPTEYRRKSEGISS